MAPGSPPAWVTPPAAPTQRRLVLSGGFTVIDGQQRQLNQQARRLGFADLSSCSRALLDDGWSIPQLAAHLDTTQAAIRRAITDHHLHQPPRPEQLARQRHQAAQQRRQARLGELGFAGIEGYLRDRYVGRGWSQRRIRTELGVGVGWLCGQLDRLSLRS